MFPIVQMPDSGLLQGLNGALLHWYNAGMLKMVRFSYILLLIISFALAACAPGSPELTQTATRTAAGTLRPYPSDTPTATPLPTGYSSPTPSPTITPTPTQVLYEVQRGDDMYSIAFRYGIEPSVLMTANPTVNPGLMSVGTSLLIPITPMPEATPTMPAEPSPTPTLRYEAQLVPDCYPDAFGGLWCFVLFENNEPAAIENVTGMVILGEGEDARQEIALTPLNVLPSGESLPLVAYFHPPLPAAYSVTAQVDFLLPMMPDDDRYLPITAAEQTVTLRDNDRVAQVEGALVLPDDAADAAYVWVNATAFDVEGHVVGVRRWKAGEDIQAGERVTFNILVYSLGGPIDRVDLLFEALRVPVESDET